MGEAAGYVPSCGSFRVPEASDTVTSRGEATGRLSTHPRHREGTSIRAGQDQAGRGCSEAVKLHVHRVPHTQSVRADREAKGHIGRRTRAGPRERDERSNHRSDVRDRINGPWAQSAQLHDGRRDGDAVGRGRDALRGRQNAADVKR
eukprot:scaffold1799_cov225-Pinguiococcus_pyrenoidosus.AAC.2